MEGDEMTQTPSPSQISRQSIKYLAATPKIEDAPLSASLNRRSENIVVEAIIVPELELRNVKMQVFPANIVECANDTALENAPDC